MTNVHSAPEHALPPFAAGVKWLRSITGYRRPVTSIAVDSRGMTLAGGSLDGTVNVWDWNSGRLVRTLDAHRNSVRCMAFDPRGGALATGSDDLTLKLWDSSGGWRPRILRGHDNAATCVAFDPTGATLASGSGSGRVRLWSALSGAPIADFDSHTSSISSLAFDPAGGTIVTGSYDGPIQMWELATAQVRMLNTHERDRNSVFSLAIDPRRDMLVSGGADRCIKLWGLRSRKLLRMLEGHTEAVASVALSPDGRLLATTSEIAEVRLWDCETWETVAVVNIPNVRRTGAAVVFHPTLPQLATIGFALDDPEGEGSWGMHIWDLDLDVLLARPRHSASVAVHHTSGKIVLLGDHSVGKSALGHRMIHGEFREQASTHGQRFWVFPAIGKRRVDGTDCEAILWDFAGQPDYRLVHALFVDNADLALVLFDASDLRDPLHGVAFWLKQLQAGQSRCPIILVAAQVDRGSSSLTHQELQAFCLKNNIVGPIHTSSASGVGVDELIACMRSNILWEDKAATVTTATFKRIKDNVLGFKERHASNRVIVTVEELRRWLEATNAGWRFTDAELITALGHLENYGYVRRLRTSQGELRILLQPERLNNLASSFVLEARRNLRGLGALEEKRLLADGYDFPELKDLQDDERDVLLDSAALLFLEHNICFRETDPLRIETYLVFPELINLKKPAEEDGAVEDGVAYSVIGASENVFASLVVLLGYTHTFTRTAQWHNNARYEMGDGLVCGFRQEAERDGELDFVLCFGANVGLPVRTLFRGLFESFLSRRNLTVLRYEPLRCSRGHLINRIVIREAMQTGDVSTFCSKCGERLSVPRMAEPIQLTRETRAEVELQQRAAGQRTRFEQAVFRLRAFVSEQQIQSPSCFISYSWGVPEHERWVEKRLATDLQKAGIDVLLDRWQSTQIGANVGRFVERMHECRYVIVVGTPAYPQKANNVAGDRGSVLAAEWDLVGTRMLTTEAQKRTVLPILLQGDASGSFPPLLQARVYSDFRRESGYFSAAFNLIVRLYEIEPDHPAVADLSAFVDETDSRGLG